MLPNADQLPRQHAGHWSGGERTPTTKEQRPSVPEGTPVPSCGQRQRGKMELSIAHHASRSPPQLTAYTALRHRPPLTPILEPTPAHSVHCTTAQTATLSQPRAHPRSQRTLHYGTDRHTLPASLSGTALEGRKSSTGARSLRPTVTRCWPHLESVS